MSKSWVFFLLNVQNNFLKPSKHNLNNNFTLLILNTTKLCLELS